MKYKKGNILISFNKPILIIKITSNLKRISSSQWYEMIAIKNCIGHHVSEEQLKVNNFKKITKLEKILYMDS